MNKPRAAPTTKCPACNGSGSVQSKRGAYAIQCRRCRGRKYVLAKRVPSRQLEIGQLKLYVWSATSSMEYPVTNGMMVALASTVEVARKLVLDKDDNAQRATVVRDLQREPRVFAEPVGITTWDGG